MLMSGVMGIGWVMWELGGGLLGNLVNPGVWMWGVTAWGVGVLPVLVMRKVYLTSGSIVFPSSKLTNYWTTAQPTTSPSPSKTLRTALRNRSSLRALGVYITCAFLLTFLHVLMTYSYALPPSRSISSTYTLLTPNTQKDAGWDPKLTPFVRSKKHPYYLNGRFLFMLLAQVVVACTFWLRNVMLDRFAFRCVSSGVSLVYLLLSCSLFVLFVLISSLPRIHCHSKNKRAN
jgi:nucleoporin NDC1